MNLQEQYWELIKQTKFEIYYLDEYVRATHTPEISINIFTAVASSASIAGWAIWNEYGLVWSIVIAVSQVVNVVKPFLPYAKRFKLLQDMRDELALLCLDIEYHWYGISQGDFTERQIHDKLFELRKKKEEIQRRNISGHYLPKKKHLIEKADIEIDKYLQQNYIGGGS